MGPLVYTILVALGGTLTDVTDDVVGVSFQYGRTREYDQFNVGTCTLAIDDRTGTYIPEAGGTWTDELWIGREVQILCGTAVLWRGFVEDLGIEVAGDMAANITVECAGPLSLLGRTFIPDGTVFAAGLTDGRISDVLALPEVNGGYFVAATTDFEVGEYRVGPFVADGPVNALEHLNAVARSEDGLLYVANGGTVGGVLTFRSRNDRPAWSGVTFTDETDVPADRDHIVFEAVDIGYRSGLLTNQVSYQRVGGVTQMAEDTAAQTLYGIRAVSESGLLNETDADVLGAAQARVFKSSSPAREVVGVTVLLTVLDTLQASTVAGLTVGDVIDVTVSVPGWQTAGPSTSRCRIERVSHDISTGAAGTHTVRFALTDLSSDINPLFIVEDATYGQLDGVGLLGT